MASGRRTVAELRLYECDKCFATQLAGDPYELVSRHDWFIRSGKDWMLVLCQRCKPRNLGKT